MLSGAIFQCIRNRCVHPLAFSRYKQGYDTQGEYRQEDLAPRGSSISSPPEGQQPSRIRDMRFSGLLLTTVTSLTFLTGGGTMSDKGENAMSEGNEALNEFVAEGKYDVQEKTPRTRSKQPRFGTMGVRQTWEECVGMTAADAVAHIKEARPDLKRILIVNEGSLVTMDMRMDRVRVFCSADGIVTRPPRVG